MNMQGAERIRRHWHLHALLFDLMMRQWAAAWLYEERRLCIILIVLMNHKEDTQALHGITSAPGISSRRQLAIGITTSPAQALSSDRIRRPVRHPVALASSNEESASISRCRRVVLSPGTQVCWSWSQKLLRASQHLYRRLPEQPPTDDASPSISAAILLPAIHRDMNLCQTCLLRMDLDIRMY